MPRPIPTTLGPALTDALARDPAQPMLTFLDGASGERTELSARTLENWVAKTANLLVDELAVEPGARVHIRLPVHWQAWVWVLATWQVQGAVLLGDAPDGADVLVATAGVAQAAPTSVERVALALRPLAAPGPAPAAGVLDYDREVRGMGDHFAPHGIADPAQLAGQDSDTRLSRDQVLISARGRADTWTLQPGDRMLSQSRLTTVGGLLDGLGVLLAGGSLVLAGNLAPGRVVSLVEQERISASLPGSYAPGADGVRPLAPVE